MEIKPGKYVFEIQPYQVDFSGNISWLTLSNLIIHTAGMHAHQCGFGVDKLLENGHAWVLSRLSTEVSEYPKSGDSLTVETWVEDVSEIFTTRGFNLYVNDQIIGAAVSSWALIDFDKRKPVPLSVLPLAQFIIPDVETYNLAPVKIDPLTSDKTLMRKLMVLYGDIDIYQHVNSVRYIQWALDSLALEFYKARTIKRLDVNFLAEALFGQKMHIYASENQHDDCLNFEIVNEENSKVVNRIKLTF